MDEMNYFNAEEEEQYRPNTSVWTLEIGDQIITENSVYVYTVSRVTGERVTATANNRLIRARTVSFCKLRGEFDTRVQVL